MPTGKELHKQWSQFKDGAGAEMIKSAKLKFKEDLGPTLDKLDKNIGTAAGQKIADELKKITDDYKKILETAQNATVKTSNGVLRATFEGPRKMGRAILDQIDSLAKAHKVTKK